MSQTMQLTDNRIQWLREAANRDLTRRDTIAGGGNCKNIYYLADNHLLEYDRAKDIWRITEAGRIELARLTALWGGE